MNLDRNVLPTGRGVVSGAARLLAAFFSYIPVFIHDFVIGVVSFALAIILRLGFGDGLPLVGSKIWLGLIFGGLLALATLAMGLSRSVWRYASITDAIRLMWATALALLAWVALGFIWTRLEDIPRTAPFIMAMATVLGLVLPRMTYRYYRENRHSLPLIRSERIPLQRVVVFGTDNAAIGFVAASRRDGSRFQVAAIIDWSGQRAGKRLHGCPVYAFSADLDGIMRDIGADRRPLSYLLVYQSAASISQAEIDRLIDLSAQWQVPIRRVHELSELNLSSDQRLQTPDILQLLGRPERLADEEVDNRFFEGKKVLVTGAGGSIGGELCRQIALRAPAGLATLESNELNLVTIGRQLAERAPELRITPILCDVRDHDRLRRVIRDFAPDIIYHAAALKHVPVTEAFPEESVLTNVGGTVAVADIARSLNVPVVVNISTDKAVNPVNILGLTKRLGELYLQGLDRLSTERGKGRTRFASVRFGNVIDSSGSVVPLFREQIASGGPLTVTDPEIERFCMSVSEAVSLVLTAHHVVDEMKDERGGLIVLDMGQSIKIDKLARQMIRLAGLRPDIDIKIAYIGLRTGEKMHEELFQDDEEKIRTSSSRLFFVNGMDFGFAGFSGAVKALLANLQNLPPAEIRASLMRIEQGAKNRRPPHIQLVQ